MPNVQLYMSVTTKISPRKDPLEVDPSRTFFFGQVPLAFMGYVKMLK